MNAKGFTLALGVAVAAPLLAATFRCPGKVTAYDPKSPGIILGTFEPQTEIEVGEALPNGMAPVTFRTPDGKAVEALCRAEDVGLAKPEALKTEAAKAPAAPAVPRVPSKVKTDDLAEGLRLAADGKKFLFVMYRRPTSKKCQALGMMMESKQVHLPSDRFVIADINADDLAQKQFFHRTFKVEDFVLPIVVVADSSGQQLAARGGRGEANDFNKFIRDATREKP